jgi:hypothetical protein
MFSNAQMDSDRDAFGTAMALAHGGATDAQGLDVVRTDQHGLQRRVEPRDHHRREDNQERHLPRHRHMQQRAPLRNTTWHRSESEPTEISLRFFIFAISFGPPAPVENTERPRGGRQGAPHESLQPEWRLLHLALDVVDLGVPAGLAGAVASQYFLT